KPLAIIVHPSIPVTTTDFAKPSAGYSDASEACKVRAWELLQNPRIQAAIFEASRGYFQGLGPALAAAGLLKIAGNPNHRDHSRRLRVLRTVWGYLGRRSIGSRLMTRGVTLRRCWRGSKSWRRPLGWVSSSC